MKKPNKKLSALDRLMARKEETQQEYEGERAYYKWEDFDEGTGKSIVFDLTDCKIGDNPVTGKDGRTFRFKAIFTSEAYLVDAEDKVISGGMDMRLPCQASEDPRSIGAQVQAAINAGHKTGIIGCHERYLPKGGNPEDKRDYRHKATFDSTRQDILEEYRKQTINDII